MIMIIKKILIGIILLLVMSSLISIGLIGCRGFLEEYDYRPGISSYEWNSE